MRTRYLSDASDLTRYILNVFHFDFENDRPISQATVSLGDGGAAVAGFVEQRFRIPPEGRVVQAAAITDPFFAGLIPEREFLLDQNGEPLLRRKENSPLEGGEYHVSYPTGQWQFSTKDAGKEVVAYYDYYHRIPPPPGPFAIILPYPPLQENTDRVASSLGVSFYRDHARPRIMNHYFPDNRDAVLYFTEHNTTQQVVVEYNFLGTRYTGAIRVNGNLRWCHRNLIYLRTGIGEAVETTGEHRYETGARLILSDEHGRTAEVSRSASPHDHPLTTRYFRSRSPFHFPPFLSKDFYRERADESLGGSGLYLSNHHETEQLSVEHAEEGITIREWRAPSHYCPVGTILDISDMVADRERVIMAEGNLRLVGTLPRGAKLTIVSGGTIYIEDHLTPRLARQSHSLTGVNNNHQPSTINDQPSSLALIAEQNVCLNLTAPAFHQRPPDNYFLRALIWSRQGTFGIIPGNRDALAEGRRTSFFFMGSLNENFHYSNREFARGFSSLEWFFDPLLAEPEHRPPWLFAWVTPQGE